jgi:preprotein translocase subunit SecG
MITVLLVVHIMIAAALVGIVLMQRSEGGALGMGGGGFMTGRGQANFLTRTTTYLAAAFFATSIALTLLANQQRRATSIFDSVPKASPTAPASPTPANPAPTGIPATPAAPAGGISAPAQPAAPAPAPAGPRGGILDKLQPKAPQ